MFCALSGISLSWKTLVLGRSTSRERTNVHQTAFFLHTPDFSLSKVTALKVVWGKDTSRRSKELGSDLPSCFSAWSPFCKCGWRHHISRSGCDPDCYSFKIFRHFWLAAIPRLIFHNRRSTSFQRRELEKKMAFAATRIWIWIWISKEGKKSKDHKKTHITRRMLSTFLGIILQGKILSSAFVWCEELSR